MKGWAVWERELRRTYFSGSECIHMSSQTTVSEPNVAYPISDRKHAHFYETPLLNRQPHLCNAPVFWFVRAS